jgi:hypothetical protein
VTRVTVRTIESRWVEARDPTGGFFSANDREPRGRTMTKAPTTTTRRRSASTGGLEDVRRAGSTRRQHDADADADADARLVKADDAPTSGRGKRTPTSSTRTVLKEDALMDDECEEEGEDVSGYSTRTRRTQTLGGQWRASEDHADDGSMRKGRLTTTKTTRGNDRYECNVCFDTAQDPVVTRCGHLYCWACIHRWLEGARGAQCAACPVCKAEVTEDALIPLYGHGEDGGDDDGRASRFRRKPRSAHHRRSGSDVLAALEPASRGLAALLGLRVGDDLTLAQANQLLLSRVLLTIGTLVVIALLVI